jgi:nucleoside-diphosphate-sugar epimerase
LITGATGFVGRALVEALAPRARLRLALRRPRAPLDGIEQAIIGNIGPDTDWRTAFGGIETVIHLAAHVHVAGDAGDAEFMRINRDGTLRLAKAAQEAGVRRFFFLSSVKVEGETSGKRVFTEADAPQPQGPYAVSKWQAEQGLARLAEAGGAAVTILRPPLVYGPGAKANFAALLRLARSGIPLPFGAVRNRRSLLFLGNLVSAIEHILDTPPRPGCHTYLLRDGEDLSTGDLIRRLAAADGRRARLLPIPPSWLRLALALLGKADLADRLLASLAVDDRRFRADFAWTPPFTVDAALARTVAAPRPGAPSWPLAAG